MVQNIITLALGATFILLFIQKIGVREWVQIHGPKLISKLFNCDFCLSFWICVVLSIILYTFVCKEIEVVLYPFLATPLVRILI